MMHSEDIKHNVNAAMMIPWAVFLSSPSFLPSNINSQPFINSYLFKTCHKCHVTILHFLSLPLRSTALFWNPRISLSHIPIASILFLTIVLVPVVQWAVSEVSVGGTYWSNKLVLGLSGAALSVTLHALTNHFLLASHYRITLQWSRLLGCVKHKQNQRITADVF